MYFFFLQKKKNNNKKTTKTQTLTHVLYEWRLAEKVSNYMYQIGLVAKI